MGKAKPDNRVDLASIADLIARAKRLAKEYRRRTGRPLGITGEVAEFEACHRLGLQLAPVRQSGYDAIKKTKKGTRRYQIKGRVRLPTTRSSQRLGRIRLEHEWDAVLLVVLTEDFEPTLIYEADRDAVKAALTAPGSKSRNKRGQLSMSKFKSIARVVWSRE